MSETAPPPAGWYPDPKPANPDSPGERWWNGSEWTVSTRTEDTTVFISGEPPVDRAPGRRPGRLLVGAVAAVVGMGVGSLVTYFAMDDNGQKVAAGSRPFAGGGNGGGQQGGPGGGSRSGGDGLNPFGGGSGGGNGSGGGAGANLAVDIADGLSIPLPGGWTGGTTKDGHASGSFGTYTCASGGSAGSTCSYAGVDTVTLTTPVSTGAQAAAEQDITAAVKESYGDVTGHQVLQEKAVTVAGRQGYLVRWQVNAKVGNNGTVETVVFPDKAGDKLVALRLGFDIADKAPSVSVMDQIVSGVADFSGSLTGGGQAPGTS